MDFGYNMFQCHHYLASICLCIPALQLVTFTVFFFLYFYCKKNDCGYYFFFLEETAYYINSQMKYISKV